MASNSSDLRQKYVAEVQRMRKSLQVLKAALSERQRLIEELEQRIMDCHDSTRLTAYYGQLAPWCTDLRTLVESLMESVSEARKPTIHDAEQEKEVWRLYGLVNESFTSLKRP